MIDNFCGVVAKCMPCRQLNRSYFIELLVEARFQF